MQTNPDYEMHLRQEEDYEMHFDDAGLKPEQTATVTPDYETQTVRPDPGCVFSDVTVEAIPEPTEEIDITENGTVDVARYGIANVAVPVGVFPEGTKLITQNVTGEDVTDYAAVDVAVPGPSGTKQISITANGTTTEDVTNYAEAEITVNTDPKKGLVFEDYDADGYPHSARFVGTWTTIPREYAYALLNYGYSSSYGLLKYVHSIVIPDGVIELFNSCFMQCTNIEEVTFPNNDIILNVNSFYLCHALKTIHLRKNVTFGNSVFYNCISMKSAFFDGEVAQITSSCFANCRSVMLYDFSHCTTIPPLYDVNSLGHASGCVIRIPAALSDTTLGEGNGWESATNWSALTNIVWEVV